MAFHFLAMVVTGTFVELELVRYSMFRPNPLGKIKQLHLALIDFPNSDRGRGEPAAEPAEPAAETTYY